MSYIMLGEQVVEVDVAATPVERAAGMAGRSNGAMLFVYSEDVFVPFTSQGIRIPLDLGFFKVDGTPICSWSMSPERINIYWPSEPFRFAVEVPASTVDLGTKLALLGQRPDDI